MGNRDTEEMLEAAKAECVRLERLLADPTTSLARDLARQADEWLQDLCDRLRVTPEQLAERYEIHSEPLDMIVHSGSIRFRQETRLIPKGEFHDQLP